MNVSPGKSVAGIDFNDDEGENEEINEETPTTSKTTKKNKPRVVFKPKIDAIDDAEMSDNGSDHMSLHDSDSSLGMEQDNADEDMLIEEEVSSSPERNSCVDIINRSVPQLEYHGKKFNNVFPIELEHIQSQMWLLVSFVVEQPKTETFKYYIGQVLSCWEEDIQMSFLRSKPSNKNGKDIFFHPVVPDVCVVNINQVIGQVFPIQTSTSKSRRQNLNFDVNL